MVKVLDSSKFAGVNSPGIEIEEVNESSSPGTEPPRPEQHFHRHTKMDGYGLMILRTGIRIRAAESDPEGQTPTAPATYCLLPFAGCPHYGLLPEPLSSRLLPLANRKEACRGAGKPGRHRLWNAGADATFSVRRQPTVRA